MYNTDLVTCNVPIDNSIAIPLLPLIIAMGAVHVGHTKISCTIHVCMYIGSQSKCLQF